MSAGYLVLPGPWGPIHVAAAARADGPPAIVALELLTPTESFVASLEGRLRIPVVPAAEADLDIAGLLARARSELESYLRGERPAFSLPIDLVGLSDWDRRVLAGVASIPYGTVTSYGRLARLIGKPGAARAVGGAVGRNPVGVLIPCHRVVAGDGSLGGYGGDWWGSREQLLGVKRGLLGIEAVGIPASSFFG